MASMAGYTKLFSSIIASTIWRADDKTRIVWITMLAMADQFGIVEGSVPGLADMARVTVWECRAALDALQQPDEDSRSKEQDGRRIEPVDGGWRLINHGKYRDKMSIDERREYHRLYQRNYRKRKPHVNTNPDKSTKLRHTEAEVEAKEEEEQKNVQALDRLRDRDEAFEAFWSVYPRKVGRKAAFAVWARLKPTAALATQIVAAVEAQCHSAQWQKDGGQFIPHPKTWLSQGRWDDQIEQPALRQMSEAAATVFQVLGEKP